VTPVATIVPAMIDALIGVKPVEFLVSAVVLTLTPGQDMTLVMTTTVGHGSRAGRETSAGLLVGVLVHLCAAVVGLSALLLASATAFTIVKIAGALYLAYLGLRMILGTLGRRRGPEPLDAPDQQRMTFFARGVTSAILNPKLAVFFLSFLPQFVDPDRMPQASMAAHGAVFIAIAATWLLCWVAMLDGLSVILRREHVRVGIERVAGTALIALGVRLAFASRG
jgi:threonine/homoserine/homoserine lactone efflux protein